MESMLKGTSRLGVVVTILFMVLLVGCTASSQAPKPGDTATVAPSSVTSPTDVPTVGKSVPNVGVVGGAPAPATTIAPQQGVAVGAPAVAPSAVTIASQPAFVSPVSPPQPSMIHGIVVSGSGNVSARPDTAVASAGVQSRAATAQEAQAQNNQTMQAVINAVKALGIPDKDIVTNGVSVYPVYEQGQFISGYSASNGVTVTVEKIDQAGAVLDAATKAGANVESGLRFTIKDDTALRNQALTEAAADAKSKANALAGALGLQISSVESVSESSTSVPYITAPRALASAAGAPAVPVEPGQIDVTAQVTIVFGY